MKIHGQAAIDFAKNNDLYLCKYSDPVEDAREDLTVDEAEEVAKVDPSLIWVTHVENEWGAVLVDEENDIWEFVDSTEH